MYKLAPLNAGDQGQMPPTPANPTRQGYQMALPKGKSK